MNKFLITTFLLYFLFNVVVYSKSPHIVFILADDLGWNDVSFHGSLQIPTPNIDVLAANGVILNNYYVQPFCTPSRAALLSGRHPIHLGLQHWVLYAAQRAGLPLDIKILPEFLKKFNYATHAVGKWHLGFHKKEYLPTYRGFDSHFGFWMAKMDYYDHTSLEIFKNLTQKYAWGDALRDDMKIVNDLKGKYATHLFRNRAISIINNHNVSQPLFLYLAPLAVHTGNSYALFQAPYNEISKFFHINQPERRIFAAIVSELDKTVGKIFNALNKKKMLDDTIFIFSTDNGAEAGGFRGGIGSNWPLRGTKGTFWEGGVRGIGIVWSKLLKQQPRIENNLMHITDWLPTLYSAAGGNVSDLGDIYGINQWETLSNGIHSPREEILHNIDPVDGASALRFKNYKLVNGSNLKGLYNGRYGPTGRREIVSYFNYDIMVRSSLIWKILRGRTELIQLNNNSFKEVQLNCDGNFPENITNCDLNVSPCLFDVRDDPCEMKNIINNHTKIAKQLLDRLKVIESKAVPLIDQYIDPLAFPILHNNAWTNWSDKE